MHVKHGVLFTSFILLTAVLMYGNVIQCYIYLISMLLVFFGYRYLRNTLNEAVDYHGKCVLITGCDTVKYTF